MFVHAFEIILVQSSGNSDVPESARVFSLGKILYLHLFLGSDNGVFLELYVVKDITLFSSCMLGFHRI